MGLNPLCAWAGMMTLRTNDVIVLVGGSTFVAENESGVLETALKLAHPGHALRIRNLAREGDTVYAQPREVNYPTLPEQVSRAGATVVFAAAAIGAPSPAYQWSRNGTAIATATNPTLVLTGANVVAGNYSVTVTNSSNSIPSNVAKLTIVATTNPGHLSNLSVLTNLDATGSSFTVATVIGPSGVAGTEPLLVRAVGTARTSPAALPDHRRS